MRTMNIDFMTLWRAINDASDRDVKLGEMRQIWSDCERNAKVARIEYSARASKRLANQLSEVQDQIGVAEEAWKKTQTAKDYAALQFYRALSDTILEAYTRAGNPVFDYVPKARRDALPQS